MKPVFGVIFRPDAPINLITFDPITVSTPLGPCQSIRCSEVLETSFGFLQLLPMRGAKNHALTLFVPPDFVLYMLRADTDEPFGFLPKAATEISQSDRAG